MASVDLEHGDVGLGIGSHHAGFEFALVGKGDAHVGGAIHDVVIGQNVAFRADDDAGAQPLLALRPRRRLPAATPERVVAIAEELAEHRIHLGHRLPRGFDYLG